MKQKKLARVALRLSEDDLTKVHHIAGLHRCTLSEAVRRLVRGAEVVVSPIVIEARTEQYLNKEKCR